MKKKQFVIIHKLLYSLKAFTLDVENLRPARTFARSQRLTLYVVHTLEGRVQNSILTHTQTQ